MVSVILSSHLSRTDGKNIFNREDRLCRAINSFLNQTHEDEKELIIIATDGGETKREVSKKFRRQKEIKFIQAKPQPYFENHIRQTAVESARGEILCYLNYHDYLSLSHIETISNAFEQNEFDWVYFDNHIKSNAQYSQLRCVILQQGKISCTSIAHRKSMTATWKLVNGDEWSFIQQLKMQSVKASKIYVGGYTVGWVERKKKKTINPI